MGGSSMWSGGIVGIRWARVVTGVVPYGVV